MPTTRTMPPARGTPADPDAATAPGPARVTAEGDTIQRGTVVGRYVVLEVLGEGGMGTVFAAHDSSLDRHVALKIVRPERADPGSEARLVQEAKAMARAAHPAIVAVHDVGSVGGRVFVAMELVRGTTLRDWLAAGRPLRDILRAFSAAGRGLEAAHAAGVIHGDFKPENVLVDEAGRVRVTDFGVACVLAKEAVDSGVPSSGGTPYYMAPEQHRAMPVDARTDQFSFCVALWQAVAGGHPFLAEGGDLAESVKQGVLRAPADPAPPRWLIQLLRRGLATDPAARFASMTPLLAQLDHQLARNRRRAVATGAVLAAGIAVGAFAMQGSSPRAPVCADAGAQLDTVWTTPRRTAIAAALGAAAGETLLALDTYGRDWRAARTEACRATQLGLQSGELLDLRMQCLDRRLAELEALASVLATGEAPVIEHASAAAHSLVPLTACSDVVALRDVSPLPTDPVVRQRVERARVALARVKADFDTGRFDKGYAGAQAAIPEANAIGYRPLIAETERLLGALAWRTDHGDVAEGALYRAIAAGEAGRAGYVTAEAWLELLWFVAQEQKHLQEARRLGVLAQAAVERYANNPGLTAALEERLGLIALDLHDLDGASSHLQRAYELRRATYGEHDPSVAASLQHLALLAVERKDQAKAIELDRQALAILEAAHGVDHPDTLLLVNTLGVALHQADRLDEALALYRRGLASIERRGGKDSSDAAMYLHNMGLVLTTRGHHDEAIAMQRRALEIYEHVRTPDNPDLADQMYELGRTYNQAGRFTEALAALEPALPATERAYGPDSADVGLVVEEIGRALTELGRPREAIAPLQRAVTLSEHGTDAKATTRARDELARARSLAARPRPQ